MLSTSGNVTFKLKRLVGVLYLDMSKLIKAFDRIQHQRMIAELHACGIGGTVLQWFASYLSDRYQQVICGSSAKASPSVCTRGVPQGSVLGPVLFTIYVRNVPSILKCSQTLQYADDLCLSLASLPTQILDMQSQLSSDSAALDAYCKSILAYFSMQARLSLWCFTIELICFPRT